VATLQSAWSHEVKITFSTDIDYWRTEQDFGLIRPGLAADMIAVRGNPLGDIDVLRDVPFVMKDGHVFKRDGVMIPAAFFYAGPVQGWRKR
jgi:imidazolonepropionase-like amidohydrolase